jgi:hypothetical protein
LGFETDQLIFSEQLPANWPPFCENLPVVLPSSVKVADAGGVAFFLIALQP